MKLCVGASSGGHMTELEALLKFTESWPVQPELIVTTLGQVDASPAGHRHFIIGECNRNTPLAAMRVAWRSCKILARERPDVIVTTGSLPLALFSLLAKLFRADVIWIDSISQVDSLSLSGRLIRPFADMFLVQWSVLAADGRAEYHGELV